MKKKTKVMCNGIAKRTVWRGIEIDREILEEVNEYQYLERCKTANSQVDTEKDQRINIGWKRFRLCMISLFITLTKVLNTVILLSMMCGVETLTKQQEEKLAIPQRIMERVTSKYLTSRRTKYGTRTSGKNHRHY